MALEFGFNEAVSSIVSCTDQKEVHHCWNGLSEGGVGSAQQCAWLKDRFGMSWQLVPTALDDMLRDADPDAVLRVTRAMLDVKKVDIETLCRAYAHG